MEEESPLFRIEMLRAKQNRLHGSVSISTSLSINVVFFVTSTLVLGLVVWLSLATYARTEVVSGMLVTTRPMEKVVAPSFGVVKYLAVAEGDIVRPGQILAEIDADLVSANGSGAAKSGVDSVDRRIKLEERQLSLSAVARQDKQRRISNTIQTAEARLAQLLDQERAQSEIANSNERLFKRLQSISDRGFVSAVEMERRQQTWKASEATVAQTRGEIASVRGDIAGARIELDVAPHETIREVNDGAKQIEELRGQRIRTSVQESYFVRARIAGRISSLQASVGRPVSTQNPLMLIVPLNVPLRAELYAPTRAVGFVRPGNRVRLLMDAFPYQQFGTVGGKVETVSTSALAPQDLDVPFKVEDSRYKIVVTIDQQYVFAYGRKNPLQPGMSLTGNIILERQSFLQWILKPLRSVWQRDQDER